jgi:hypothetical protein
MKIAIFDKLIISIKSDKSKKALKTSGLILILVFMNRDVFTDTFFKHDLIGEGLIQQRDIKRELNKLVKQYKANYVAINLFHNGSTALNGTHFKKMSREYEGRKNGKPPLTFVFKNYDIEPFSDEFLAISENLTLYIPEIDKYPNQYLKNTLKRGGYKSVLYVAIKDRDFWNNDIFIGFMTYEFSVNTNFTEADIEEMRMQYDLKLRDLVKAK